MLFMANWLTKATGGLSREAEDVPPTFQLTCECGEQHIGHRKARPQRIICQTCGTALFVLPKNVYPPPKSRSATGKKSSKRRGDGPPRGPRLPSPNKLAASVREGLVGAAQGAGHGFASAVRGVRQWIVSSLVAMWLAVRRLFTPFRLIVTGMAVMLLATAFVAIRARARERARETFRVELAAGQTALEENDHLAARDHFAAAVDAVDTLGSDDAQSRLVRQLHRETTAMTRLATGSLFDMLDDAERTQRSRGTISWNGLFSARYEGTWLVLQAPIRRVDSEFVLDLPLTVGDQNRRVTVYASLAGFEQLLSADNPTDAIFAAPLHGCELSDSGDEWIVTLDGEAGFLWSTVENLKPLGFFESAWSDEDEVAAVLDRQGQIAGGRP